MAITVIQREYHVLTQCYPPDAVQFDSADDKKKGPERPVSDEEAAIADAQEGIAALKDEIANLAAGIKALDEEEHGDDTW